MPKPYACYNLDENVRASSSSGGMFTLFAESILESGGIVFGAAFDDNLEVRHIGIESKEDLHRLRSSKYMQSIIGDTYRQAKEILESHRPVLFSGTPCQISGLLSYLGKSYDNLYTQDIICHGVPSSKLWKMYLKHLESLHKSKINPSKPPSFRNKALGWLNYSVKVNFENNIEYSEMHRRNLFMRVYLSDVLLRPSCYKCSCKSLSRNSDITLADFWGANKIVPDMFDDKGTSLVFINTEKGRRLFANIKKSCAYKETDIDSAVRHNPSAHTSVSRPLKRKRIMKNMNGYDFETLQDVCTKTSFLKKVYLKLRRIWRNNRR